MPVRGRSNGDADLLIMTMGLCNSKRFFIFTRIEFFSFIEFCVNRSGMISANNILMIERPFYPYIFFITSYIYFDMMVYSLPL